MRHRSGFRFSWAALAACFGSASPAQGPARLVRDLAPGQWPRGSSTFRAEILVGQPLTYFVGGHGTGSGAELWCTDGTEGGTRLVKDIWPGPGSSLPRQLTSLGGIVYFVAEEAAMIPGLWRSDGTSDGTWRVDSGFTIGGEVLGAQIARVGDRLVVVLDETAREIWGSDGTPAGTRRLAHFGPTGETTGTLDAGLLFSFYDLEHGNEPWVTDGTPAGTRLLVDVEPGAGGSYVQYLTPRGPSRFFVRNQGSLDAHLWSTDGTPAGTRQLPTPPAMQSWREIGITGCWSLLHATTAAARTELWRSDGTPSGTVRLLADSPVAWPLGTLGSAVVFASGQGTLWRSDGTAQGTRVFGSQRFLGFGAPLTVLGDRGFFLADDGSHGSELWVTDGTDAGTRLFLELVPGPGGDVIGPPASDGQRLYFRAWNELWTSDGTAAGTRRVRSIGSPAMGSSPQARATSPDWTRTLWTTGSDFAWWESDGTGAGTRLLGAGSNNDRSHAAVATWEASYFLVPAQGSSTLMRSDAAGTRSVRTLSSPAGADILGTVGNTVLVAAGDTLWRSDGTPAGTMPYFRFPVPAGQVRFDRAPVALGGVTVFVADDGVHGRELWRTDGTASGTFLLHDFSSSQPGTACHSLVVAGNEVLAILTDRPRQELWRTDGTVAGTRWVADLSAFPEGGEVVAAGDRLFLVVGRYGHLLVRDHPASGLRLIADGASPFMAALGENVVMLGYDEPHGHELWSSDGTTAGTRRIKDFAVGSRSGVHVTRTALHALPGARRALVTAFSEAAGFEVWSTDGTTAGTTLVQDVDPGNVGSLPDSYALAGSTVLFSADDGVHGRELWGLAAPASVLPVGQACPGPSGPAPILRGDGAPLVGNAAFALELLRARAEAPAWIALGTRARPTWLGTGCGWFADDLFLTRQGRTEGSGRWRVALPVPNDPVLTGTSVMAQAVVAEESALVPSGAVKLLFGTW